ncbi:signal recognition particle protein [Nanoarchaeota archaeon]|nr:MAG: signal recognition particle protein [Nanoarchaeota archaeon]
MLEGLRESLRKVIRAIHVDESLLEEVIRDIQRELIKGDVDVKLVFELSERIRKRVKEERALSKRELLIRAIYEELVSLLGEGRKIEIKEKPTKILLVGLFGSGKTTTCAKLAHYYKKRGYKVLMLALDKFRPAAEEQLRQLGEKIKVKVSGEIKDLEKYDVVIADSAGRDALDKNLIKEIKRIKTKLKPQEILLILSADIGQNAGVQAEKFHEALGITGVIVTKMDGTAKGGGALTACAKTGSHVVFLGTGEKVEDLEVFEPKRFVSRLLGMGDLESILEKAREVMDEKKAEKVAKKMLSGEMNLLDLYEQLENLSKMGPLNKLVELIPGLSLAKIPKVEEDKIKRFKHIMDSMTKEELEHPEILNSSRIRRIARGSGTSESEVRELIKQYNLMKRMMKGFRGRKMEKLLRRLGM